MKYCESCGKALLDDELCNCREEKSQTEVKEDAAEEVFFDKSAQAASAQTQGFQFFKPGAMPDNNGTTQQWEPGKASTYHEVPEGMGKCIATAILYPFIMIVIAIGVFSFEGTSWLGLILTIASNVGAAACIIYGGFYLFIIPLPIIYLAKFGCVKAYLPMWKRILFGTLSFLLIFGSIAFLILF